MRVLAVDCADKAVSCAIADDDRLIIENFASTGFTHSKTLMPMLSSMLEIAEIAADSIDLYAVTSGPGSFTGLRIGIAAVKGLAFKNGTPCAGVSTLHAIAASARERSGIICAVMDARCSQVYNALFRCEDGRLERLCGDRAVMCAELKNELDELYKNDKIYIVGPGAKMFCSEFGDKRFVSPAARNIFPRASDVALIAGEYDRVRSEELRPTYLRLPQAERELKERKNNNG